MSYSQGFSNLIIFDSRNYTPNNPGNNPTQHSDSLALWVDVNVPLYASKVMLKIFQARLQQYVNQELPDVQAELRKGRGTRD